MGAHQEIRGGGKTEDVCVLRKLAGELGNAPEIRGPLTSSLR